jgi:hypothetical protein
MKRIFLPGLAAALIICLFDSSSADEGKDELGKGYYHLQGYGQLNIPKGHYPAPGECRIWYPDRSPGQQPPPGKCELLRRTVPPGAWLIRHPEDDPNHVHVIVFDEQRPGTVRAVGEIETGSGVFVRILLDR